MVVFSGPQVSGAIRNQFNQVTKTVDSGTEGGASGGGSTDTASATVQAAVAKDAKDWTLDEQKAEARDRQRHRVADLLSGFYRKYRSLTAHYPIEFPED